MNHKASSSRKFFLISWLHWPNDDKRKTFIVAALLSLVCSLMVATAAVVLKPQQETNKRLEIQRNILNIAGVPRNGKSAGELFNKYIEVRLINIPEGTYADLPYPEKYDWRNAMSDPATSMAVNPEADIAKIKRRPRILPVYLVEQEGQIVRLILPIYGYGLWSTMYGFLALEPDAQTVAGLTFYEQAETPGLGGEVNNPDWRNSWEGKLVYDEQGEVRLAAIRGRVKPDSEAAKYQVDGLSGATLTTQGVTNLLQYWLSDEGFGQYLKRFKEETT